MTESDKQQVELNPFDIRKELTIYQARVENAVIKGESEFGSFASYEKALKASDEQAQKIIGAWSTRHSPDREKIREALALLERYAFPNDSTHGCSVIGDGPDLKHCEDCDLGNAIYILKQLTL